MMHSNGGCARKENGMTGSEFQELCRYIAALEERIRALETWAESHDIEGYYDAKYKDVFKDKKEGDDR